MATQTNTGENEMENYIETINGYELWRSDTGMIQAWNPETNDYGEFDTVSGARVYAMV